MDKLINIGTEKSCFFVYMSNKLLNKLRENPLLFYAVEEAMISAKNGYYSIGIIVWYELLKSILNANNQNDSKERIIPAHYILKERPTKESYEKLLKRFETEAKRCYLIELTKNGDKNSYLLKLDEAWNIFFKEMYNK